MKRIVRKSAIQVELSLVGHHPILLGSLFLASRGRSSSLPESLPDFLQRNSERMIPFERQTDGAMLLVSRRQVEWVRPLSSGESASGPVMESRHSREELVRVRFAGGGEIEGLLQLDLDEPCARASDFINNEAPFFTILTPSGPCHVNKESILDIRVFEVSPVPPLPEPAG